MAAEPVFRFSISPEPDQVSSETDNSLRDWIALSFITGVGSRTAATLIERFGSPAACFKASSLALEAASLKREAIEAIKGRDALDRADREIQMLAQLGGEALTLNNPRYPALLRETYDPPIVLYA